MASETTLSQVRELAQDIADLLSLLQFEKSGMNSALQTDVEVTDLVQLTKERLEKLRAELPPATPRFQQGDLVTHPAMPGVGKFWAYHTFMGQDRCKVDAPTDPVTRLDLSLEDLRPHVATVVEPSQIQTLKEAVVDDAKAWQIAYRVSDRKNFNMAVAKLYDTVEALFAELQKPGANR